MQHPSGLVLNLLGPSNGMAGENVLMDVDEKYPGYTHVALEVSNVDSMKAALESKNIKITEGPVTFPGGRSIFIRDQDRNVIEFHEPTE